MKEQKYLPLYYEWMRLGRVRYYSGLCGAILNLVGSDAMLNMKDLFMPDIFEYGLFWASENTDCCVGEFNPTRQNIILFLAAMNDEL